MMSDRTVMQEAVFYSFSLEDHVPKERLLRSIDRFVDLSGIREQVELPCPDCANFNFARIALGRE